MKDELLSAFHQLRRRPGFALGAALSLAIGMSLATALFSVVDSALLKPLRVVVFLDALFRSPMMVGPLVSLPVTPTIACAGTLTLVLLLGTAVPLRRVLRLDVMRVIQRGN